MRIPTPGQIQQIKEENERVIPELARRLAPVFEKHQWKWAFVRDPNPEDYTDHYGIPNAKRIEKTLRYIAKSLTDGCQTGIKPGSYYPVRTGRLIAVVSRPGEGDRLECYIGLEEEYKGNIFVKYSPGELIEDDTPEFFDIIL